MLSFGGSLLSHSDIASRNKFSIDYSQFKAFFPGNWKFSNSKDKKPARSPTLDEPVGDVDIDIFDVSKFYPLKRLSSIPEKIRANYHEELQTTSYDLVRNPFTHGLFCVVFYHQNKSYLKMGVTDNFNAFEEDSRVYQYGVNHKLSCKNLLLAINYSPKTYTKIFDFLRNGRAPLQVLVHHCMLYNFYPEDFQDALWCAVQAHVMNQVRLGRATLLHARACYQKIGDIRMYLIDPHDLYFSPNSLKWLIICSKQFQALVHLEVKMDTLKIFRRRSKYFNLARSCVSGFELSWLIMMTSIGSNASAVPVHAYLASKRILYPSIIPEEIFFMRKFDSSLFKDIKNIHELLGFLGRLFMDLQDCEKFHHDYTEYHCYRIGKPLYQNYEEEALRKKSQGVKDADFIKPLVTNTRTAEKYKAFFEYKRNIVLKKQS